MLYTYRFLKDGKDFVLGQNLDNKESITLTDLEIRSLSSFLLRVGVDVSISKIDYIFTLNNTTIQLTKFENGIYSVGSDINVKQDENNLLFTLSEIEKVKELLEKTNISLQINL